MVLVSGPEAMMLVPAAAAAVPGRLLSAHCQSPPYVGTAEVFIR
jgi:hypothetical protein